MTKQTKKYTDSRTLEGIAALVDLAEVASAGVQSAKKKYGEESIEALNARAVWIAIKFLLEDYDSVKMSTWVDMNHLYRRGDFLNLTHYYEGLRWLIPAGHGPADVDVEKIDAESDFPISEYFWKEPLFNPMMAGFMDLIHGLRKQGLDRAQKCRIFTAALAWMSLHVTFYRDKYPQPNDMTKWIEAALKVATGSKVLAKWLTERLDGVMDLGTVDFLGTLSRMLAAKYVPYDEGFARRVPNLAKANDARYVRASSPELVFRGSPKACRGASARKSTACSVKESPARHSGGLSMPVCGP